MDRHKGYIPCRATILAPYCRRRCAASRKRFYKRIKERHCTASETTSKTLNIIVYKQRNAMALTVIDSAERTLLDDMLRNSSGENFTLKLYTNSLSPSGSTALGDITDSGIAGQTLTRSSWSSATTVGGAASTQYAECTFTASGAVTIRGYYIVGATSGNLYMLENVTARSLQSGDQIKITPKFTGNTAA